MRAVRAAVGALILNACTFAGSEGSGQGPDAAPDAQGTVDAPIEMDAAVPFEGLMACPMSADLLACYLMDGSGTDGSMFGNDGDVVNGVEFVLGLAGSAASFTADDQMTVTQNGNSLDAPENLTIEAWLFMPVEQVDAEGRVGIFDKNGDYSMFIHTDRSVRCSGAGGVQSVPNSLPLNDWFHVACTYELTSGWTLYVDAVPVQTELNGGTISTGGLEVDIGSNSTFQLGRGHFVGMIDNLLVWEATRTRQELCTSSGIDCN